jgi:hypothetical protein
MSTKAIAPRQRRPRAVDRAVNEYKAREAFRMMVAGKTLPSIAKALCVQQVVVYNWIESEVERLRPHLDNVAKRELFLQLAKLDRLYEQAMEAWERSCGKRREQTVASEETLPFCEAGVQSLQPVKLRRGSRKTVTQYGDPRFLAEARHILAEKRKLLGMDSPDAVRNYINVYASGQTVQVANVGSSGGTGEVIEIAEIIKRLGIEASIQGGEILRALPGPGGADSEVGPGDAEAETDEVRPAIPPAETGGILADDV